MLSAAPRGPRPQLKRCYLCGQEFGSASIGIHIPQCYSKKVSQWEAGNPTTRGQRPKHPDTVNWKGTGMNSTQYQEEQAKEYEANLSPCPNCGRTFLPDRLQVHLRSCKSTNNNSNNRNNSNASARGGNNSNQRRVGPQGSSSTMNSSSNGGGGMGATQRSNGNTVKRTVPGVPPVLPRCYLCGQQFGTTSIGIHVPQCYAKKIAQWHASDPATRGQAPKHPDTLNWKGEGLTKDQQNDEQFKEFVSNLEPCPNCGRKFLADRLVVHLRSCKPGSTSKPVTHRTPSPGISSEASASATSSPQPPSEKPLGPPSRGGQKSSPTTANMPSKSPTGAAPPQHLDPKRNRIPSASKAGDDMQAGCMKCVQCGAVEYDKNAKFCRDCGRNLRSKNLPDPCSRCGEAVPEGSRFCATCGQPVDNAKADERTPGDENINAPTVRMTNCPACRALCDADGNFCDNCGAALGDAEPVKLAAGTTGGNHHLSTPVSPAAPEEIMYCETCNEECSDLTAIFCEECGEKLSRKSVLPPPVAAPKASQKSQASPGSKSGPAAQSRGGGSAAHQSRATNSVPQTSTEIELDNDLDESAPVELIPCDNCGRRFAEAALDRHMRLCTKTKTRPVFNMTKQRLEGTDIPMPLKKSSPAAVTAPPKRDWKAESENLRNALREARKVDQIIKAGGDLKALPPPTYSVNPDYVQCQHCQRRFAADVAARHIPKCATTINRPKAPPKRR